MTTEASTQARSEVTGSDLLLVARQQSRASLVFGIVLVSLGVFAIMAPLFSGIATAVLVGMLLAAGGVVEGMFAFQAPSFGKGLLRKALHKSTAEVVERLQKELGIDKA